MCLSPPLLEMVCTSGTRGMVSFHTWLCCEKDTRHGHKGKGWSLGGASWLLEWCEQLNGSYIVGMEQGDKELKAPDSRVEA